MSFVVMAIGAAHSIPPIAGAVITKSKVGTIIGAVIAGFIAFASGNPAFVAADLIGVGIGTWLGFAMVATSPRN